MLRRTPDAVYLVSGAGGPLGGDLLDLRVDVREGAALRLRTVAASVALPGRDGQESVLTVTATVGAGGRFEFLPEPTVVADGARHRIELHLRLADGAALVLRDEVILGRHGERGGSCRARLRADLAGAPLLRHEIEVCGTDPASLGPAVLAGHRAAGSLLWVEPSWGAQGGPACLSASGPGSAPGPGVAVMPLAGGPAVLVTALATDALTLRRRLSWAPAPAPAGVRTQAGPVGSIRTGS